MFKAVIIDDEYYIVEGLKKILDWSSYGIEIAATALDGVEGLELIKKINPDIVITDICMNNMDGLEMIEQLQQTNFCGKIIILSGYQKFEYAQRAINSKVTRYILKPINIDEFEIVIGEVVRELKESENPNRDNTNRIGTKAIHSKLADDLINYVDEHYTEDIQMTYMAEMFHCSVAYMGKVFKRNTGMNFKEYVTRKRVNKAKELLRCSYKSIEDIQFEIGYHDAKYFRKVFKELTGVSPRRYRQCKAKGSED